MVIKIVDLPMNIGDFPVCYVNVYQSIAVVNFHWMDDISHIKQCNLSMAHHFMLAIQLLWSIGASILSHTIGMHDALA